MKRLIQTVLAVLCLAALRNPATGQVTNPAAASSGPVVELELPAAEGAIFECQESK